MEDKERLMELCGQYRLRKVELVKLKIAILKLAGELKLTDALMIQMEW